jgi:hypothetical protein
MPLDKYPQEISDEAARRIARAPGDEAYRSLLLDELLRCPRRSLTRAHLQDEVMRIQAPG